MSAGGQLDSSQNQVADVEVMLVDVAIMIALELLLISRMLNGGRQAVLQGVEELDVLGLTRVGGLQISVD